MAFNLLSRSVCLAVSLAVPLAAGGCAAGPAPNEVAVADPAPDSDPACYSPARIPFYHASNTALLVDKEQERTKRNGEMVAAAGIILTLATLPVGGVGGQIARGVGAAMTLGGALAASVTTDQRLIADVSNTFTLLVVCRQTEARHIRAEVRAHKIKPAEGREQLRSLHDLMVTDAMVAHEVNLDLSRRNQVYLLATSKIETDVPADPVARAKQANEVAQAKQTLQSSQHALTDQASLIDKAAQTITVSSIEPASQPA